MASRARKTKLRSFEVDHRALEGIPAAEAYVLGIEWGIIWQRAQSPAPVQVWVHESNAHRVQSMLRDLQRRFSVGQTAEGLVQMSIAGLD
jgi:hypothetical protein